VSEKPVRVGDLVKATELTRDQVLAAVTLEPVRYAADYTQLTKF
jgi:hypothetical protein